MKVIDVHVHLSGKIRASDAEKFLEKNSLTAMVLLSRSPIGKGAKVRQYIQELAELHAKLGDRVYPFAFLDAKYEKSPDVLEWAVRKCGMRGLKLIPANYHPREECARALYALAGKLRVPLLNHVGILWAPGDNAANCRPANMEVMWDYPDTRFAMAHIGWPWTDECVAVAQKFHFMRPELDQVFVDLTPGTPPSYREGAIAKCLENVGADRMLYGSDSCLPVASWPAGHWQADRKILDRLKVPAGAQRKIFAENALRFLGAR